MSAIHNTGVSIRNDKLIISYKMIINKREANTIPRYNSIEDFNLQALAKGWKTIEPIKVIFLDVDGVLNGWNKRTYIICNVTRFLRISPSKVSKIIKVFEVKEKYVRRLSKIVKSTNAKIVMSSSWRHGFWNVPYEEKYQDQKRLHDLLNKYKLEVIDITPSSRYGVREDEINQWLKETKMIVDRFVILDDESSDLQSFVGRELVKTSKVIEGDMIKGLPYEDTGLKRMHVRQAIKILNNERVGGLNDKYKGI